MKNPKVAIIILNWNGWKDTIESLESIFLIEYPNYNVVLVDNNSSDDSIKKIIDYTKGDLKVKSSFFEYSLEKKPIKYTLLKEIEITNHSTNNEDVPLTIIKTETNHGFAEGNNIGIRYGLNKLNPDYFLLLNNDTVVDKYFLNSLVIEGENNKKIGLLGPKIYYYDNPNIIWCIGGKIDWKLARGLNVGTNECDNGQYDDVIKENFDYISGSALMIKKKVIEEVGLLDKRFFLYFEETDLALRASLKGYKNLFVPDAKIWHKVSKSGGGIKNEIGLYYITRNRWLFMKKWAKINDFLIFIPIQILMAIFVPIFLSIHYNEKKLFLAYYRGLWDGLTNVSED